MELATDRKKKLVYFSVDTETSGPIPGAFSLLSIGVCLVRDLTRTWYIELQPLPGSVVDPEAMAVNKLDYENLLAFGALPSLAMALLAKWVRYYAPPETHKAVFVGFNATFDWMWTHWYFVHFLRSIDDPFGKKADPFGISGMDIKAFAAGLHHEGWDKTYKKDLRERYPSPLPHSHNALEDAVEQADLMRQLLSAHNMLFEIL